MESNAVITALAALAQENRLAIFRLLIEAGPTGQAAGEIASDLGIAPATLSFHLKELSRAGLVTARPEGRFIFYAAAFDTMTGLIAYLTQNCCSRDGIACAPALPAAAGCCPPVPAAKRKGAKA